MTAETEVLSQLRAQLVDIIAGTFFLLIAAIALGIAVLRRRAGTKILVWLGILSALFGINPLAQTPAVVAAFPQWSAPVFSYIVVFDSYLTLVAGAFAFLQLTMGGLRRLFQLWLAASVVVAVAGIGWFLISGAPSTFIPSNQVLAALGLIIMLVVLTVPKLSRKYLVLSKHRVLTMGMWIFVAEAAYSNIAHPLKYAVPDLVAYVGFGVLLFSFGYVALEMVLNEERRLLSLDKELQIARDLQASILPSGVPQVAGFRIAASYLPMTAVAGDFYEFIDLDERRLGVLVADVSGHGVPAALVASTLKVAMHSADGCTHAPGEVLRRLGNILHSDMRGQFVSAAYLWIDGERRTARYSAAGHPPLLHWRAADNTLLRIESNGLLFGIFADGEYPECNISLGPGDRLLLYTDGLTEPENSAQQAFGDSRLEQVIRESRTLPASELSQRLLEEVRAWRRPGVTQEDDITLIVIDVR